MQLRMQSVGIAMAGLCAALAFSQDSQPPAAPAPLRITGAVSTPLELKAEDFAKLPHQTVSVHSEDGTTVEYAGVPLRDLLERAGAPGGKTLRGKALASYVLAKARDGYQVVFGLAEFDPAFANEQILVADKRDGKPLFGYQGPFRLVCPNDKAGARSVRMLESIEVVSLQK